ncbi:hypothetical protein BB561_002556 [Smittium simulii]|uniref:Pentacotripeptide-repeat region of PRORP domain-containing protein n=1 Tax=Smittium simulii TaxID=133385 RepID=A0A2T9YQ23_9FUNG|nr:hypothetical protein BB561_002556 [Smittium simulii]
MELKLHNEFYSRFKLVARKKHYAPLNLNTSFFSRRYISKSLSNKHSTLLYCFSKYNIQSHFKNIKQAKLFSSSNFPKFYNYRLACYQPQKSLSIRLLTSKALAKSPSHKYNIPIPHNSYMNKNITNPWSYLLYLIINGPLCHKSSFQKKSVLSFELFEKIIYALNDYKSNNYQKKILLLKNILSKNLPFNDQLLEQDKSQIDPSAHFDILDFFKNDQVFLANLEKKLQIYNIWTAHSTFETLSEIFRTKNFNSSLGESPENNTPYKKIILQKLYLKGFHSNNIALCLNSIIFNSSGILISRKHRLKLYNRFFSSSPESGHHLIEVLFLAKIINNLLPKNSFNLTSYNSNLLLLYLFNMNFIDFVTHNAKITNISTEYSQLSNSIDYNQDSKSIKKNRNNSVLYRLDEKNYNILQSSKSDHVVANTNYISKLNIDKLFNESISWGLTLLRKMGAIKQASTIYDQHKNNFNTHLKLAYYNNLISFYSYNTDSLSVSTLLNKILAEDIIPNNVTWDLIAKGFFRNNHPGKALNLYNTLGEITKNPTVNQNSVNFFDYFSDIKKSRLYTPRSALDKRLINSIMSFKHKINSEKLLVDYNLTPSSRSIVLKGLGNNRLYRCLLEYRDYLNKNQMDPYQQILANFILLEFRDYNTNFVSMYINNSAATSSFHRIQLSILLNNITEGRCDNFDLKTVALILSSMPWYINESIIAKLLNLLTKYSNVYSDAFINNQLLDLLTSFLPLPAQDETRKFLQKNMYTKNSSPINPNYTYIENAEIYVFANIIFTTINSVNTGVRNKFYRLVEKDSATLYMLMSTLNAFCDNRLFFEITANLLEHIQIKNHQEFEGSLFLKVGIVNCLIRKISSIDPKLAFAIIANICNNNNIVSTDDLNQDFNFDFREKINEIEDNDEYGMSKLTRILKNAKMLNSINYSTLTILIKAAKKQKNIELAELIIKFFRGFLCIDYLGYLNMKSWIKESP